MPSNLSYPRSPFTERIPDDSICQPGSDIISKPINLDFRASVTSIHAAFLVELKKAPTDKEAKFIRQLQRNKSPA
jgi:hypothetical protein